MVGLDHVEPADRAADQDRTATDDDDGQRLGRQARALDAILQHGEDLRLRPVDQVLAEMGDLGPVAEVDPTRGSRHIGRGQRGATEDQRLALDAVTDRGRADLDAVGAVDHQRTAAKTDREDVGHAEIGAHRRPPPPPPSPGAESPSAASRHPRSCRRYRRRSPHARPTGRRRRASNWSGPTRRSGPGTVRQRPHP